MNASEADFDTIAEAAHDAMDAGKVDLAHRLDKIARKINADLAGRTVRNLPNFGGVRKQLTWQEVPSLFAPLSEGRGSAQ